MDPVNRYDLEQQGYTDLDGEALTELAPWLGLAPAVCSGVTLAATLAGSGLAMLLLAPVGVAAAFSARHPAEWIADRTVRRARRSVRPIPLAGPPRRFAYAFAAAWLGAAGAAFLAGLPVLGAALGLAFTVATGMAAATGFCVACKLWHGLRPRSGPVGAREAPAWPRVRLTEDDL